MTLPEAVAVLNERRHNGCDKWDANDEFAEGRDRYECLSAFEAIAVALAYTAQGGAGTLLGYPVVLRDEVPNEEIILGPQVILGPLP